jgi:hypothetical protein
VRELGGWNYAGRFLIGVALLGYTLYEVRTGQCRGKWRIYDRYDEPVSFWMSILLQLGISFAFLLGVH